MQNLLTSVSSLGIGLKQIKNEIHQMRSLKDLQSEDRFIDIMEVQFNSLYLQTTERTGSHSL